MYTVRRCFVLCVACLPILTVLSLDVRSVIGQEDVDAALYNPTKKVTPSEDQALRDMMAQRLQDTLVKGIIFSDLELSVYSDSVDDSKSGLDFVKEWQKYVYPEVLMLGAPKSGSTSLWACYTSGLFDRDIACRGALEPCRRPYIWNSDKPIKEFGQLEAIGLSGTLNDQYLEYFPERTATRTYAKSVDGLPRLLAHHSVFAHLSIISPDPTLLRFIVTIREPVVRSYSEWKYFKRLREKYDRFTDLVDLPYEEKLTLELDELIACWPELSSDPGGVLMMPYAQFYPLYRKCIEWSPDNHVRTGLYVLALRNWSQFFHRDQFNFQLQESQTEADHSLHDKMADFADFVGVHLDKGVLKTLVEINDKTANSEIDPAFRTKLENVYETCNTWTGVARSNVVESEVTARLQEFFKPYNKALAAALPHLNIPWA